MDDAVSNWERERDLLVLIDYWLIYDWRLLSLSSNDQFILRNVDAIRSFVSAAVKQEALIHVQTWNNKYSK